MSKTSPSYTTPNVAVISPQKPTESGRFVIRMPPTLHAALKEAAQTNGLSLNAYCVRRLSVAGLGPAIEQDAVGLVARAWSVADGGVSAVILHGSWVRGEAMAASDVDALVVLEEHIPLTRALYRAWDEGPDVTWRGHRIDPHFVRTPTDASYSGMWAEVALDGIVLFDRDWRVSAHLSRVRQAIASGRLVRGVVHGQPYWALKT